MREQVSINNPKKFDDYKKVVFFIIYNLSSLFNFETLGKNRIKIKNITKLVPILLLE